MRQDELDVIRWMTYATATLCLIGCVCILFILYLIFVFLT